MTYVENICMLKPFDEPLPLKLIFIYFSHSTNLCHGNLKIIETVSVIEPWVKWMGVLYLPSILLMKSKFLFRRLGNLIP